MPGLVILGFFVTMFVITIFWKRRDNARIDEILRAGAAGEMHDVNIQGRVDPNLLGIVDAGPPSGHAGGFYGTSR